MSEKPEKDTINLVYKNKRGENYIDSVKNLHMRCIFKCACVMSCKVANSAHHAFSLK